MDKTAEPKQLALKDINLEFQPGKFYAVKNYKF